MSRVALSCLAIAVTLSFHRVAGAPVTLFVNCVTGSDTNAGSSSTSPFKSLNRARDAVRALARPLAPGGVDVFVAPGVCVNTTGSVLLLDDALLDSGAAGAPISYFGAPGTFLSAGLALPSSPSAWAPIPASPGCFSTPLASVPGFISSASLGSLRAGALGECASGKAALFVGTSPTTMARYPNINASTGEWEWLYAAAATPHAAGGGSVTVNSSRPLDKGWPSSTWLHGFWQEDWADSYVRMESATPTPCPKGGACTTLHASSTTPPVYDFTPKCRVMAVDLLEELDAEGESFVDAVHNTVSFCPSGGSMTGLPPLYLSMGDVVISIIGEQATPRDAHWSDTLLIEAHPTSFFYASTSGADPTHVAFVTISGFEIAHSRVAGVSANSVSNLVLRDLNVAGHGASGVEMHDAWDSVVSNVTIRSVGCHALSLSGGDSASLTPANLSATGLTISDFARVTRTYNPGVAWGGVGITLSKSEIFDGPHSGILGGGNDCVFASNHLHDLCYEATDSGGWYAGRSWVHRGNVLRDNLFENIFVREHPQLGSPALNAIYLDDELSGQTLINNTIRNVFHGLLLGGGRDNFVSGNSFTDLLGGYAVTFDARGLGWQKGFCHYNASVPAASGELVTDLFAVHYTQPPYSTHYPLLPSLLSDRPCTPVGNTIADNTYCRASSGFSDTTDAQAAAWGSVMRDNVEKCA